MKRLSFTTRTWFRVFAVSLALFVATDQVTRITGAFNLIPTILLIGAFMIPVAFVTYTYQYEPVKDVSLPIVAICFLWGGAIGVLAAGFLEYATLMNLGLIDLIGVGIIEEAVKLTVPVAMYVRRHYCTEAHGLLFGVASGIGFAALETMGYGLTALIRSRGDIGALESVLLLRGILAPVGHAAWTGILAAVIWRERARGRGIFNRITLGAFLLVAALHALWDIFNSYSGSSTALTVVFGIGTLVVAGFSLTMLVRRMREAAHSTLPNICPEI